jgi:hypothetical protein
MTDLSFLGVQRFGSSRWSSMTIKLAAELEKSGINPDTLTPDVLSNLAWAACLEAWGAETAHGANKHCTRKVAGVIAWYGDKMALQERLTGAVGRAPGGV